MLSGYQISYDDLKVQRFTIITTYNNSTTNYNKCGVFFINLMNLLSNLIVSTHSLHIT